MPDTPGQRVAAARPVRPMNRPEPTPDPLPVDNEQEATYQWLVHSEAGQYQHLVTVEYDGERCTAICHVGPNNADPDPIALILSDAMKTKVDMTPEPTAWEKIVAEARQVISLGGDDQYVGGQDLAEMILEFAKEGQP